MLFEKCNKPGGVLTQIAEDQAKLKEQVDTTAADLYRKQEELRKNLMGGLYRGEYDPNLKYDIGETVSLNGTVYQSKIENNPDAPPSNNWRTINEVNVYVGDNSPPEQGVVEYGKTLINLTNGRTYTADGDGTVKYIGGAVDVDTVEELETLDGVHRVAVLEDKDRGGVFVYDASKSNENDGGIVFNGWVRQYNSNIKLEWFGAIGDGVTDDTIPFKNALQYSKKVIGKKGKKYLIKEAINIIEKDLLSEDIELIFDNNDNSYGIYARGKIEEVTTISQDINKKEVNLQINDSSTLKVGDIIFIETQTDWTTSIKASYITKILDIDGTTITVEKGTIRPLLRGDKIYKITPIKVELNNVKTDFNKINDNFTGIHIQYAISNNTKLDFKNAGYSMLHFKDCYNPRVSNSSFFGAKVDGLSYGISIENSANPIIEKISGGDCRHIVTCGGVGGVVTDYTVRDVIATTTEAIVDAHPACDAMYVDNIKGRLEGTDDFLIMCQGRKLVATNINATSNQLGITFQPFMSDATDLELFIYKCNTVSEEIGLFVDLSYVDTSILDLRTINSTIISRTTTNLYLKGKDKNIQTTKGFISNNILKAGLDTKESIWARDQRLELKIHNNNVFGRVMPQDTIGGILYNNTIEANRPIVIKDTDGFREFNNELSGSNTSYYLINTNTNCVLDSLKNKVVLASDSYTVKYGEKYIECDRDTTLTLPSAQKGHTLFFIQTTADKTIQRDDNTILQSGIGTSCWRYTDSNNIEKLY